MDTSSSLVLKPKSCLACRTRKVKCDRVVPCANCARWAIDCVFPSPIRRCSRPRTKQPNPDSAFVDRISILEAQISHLTDTLTVQSHRLQLLNGTHPPPISSVNYTFSDAVPILYPPPATAQTCWHIFLDSIDPLVKVAYQPSAYRILRRTSTTTNIRPSSPGETALALALYLATLSTMQDPDLQTSFQMTKATAIATYRRATEQALLRANFLTTDDTTTAQALVLFASFSLYQRDHRSAWSLTGVARRLHRSPSTTLSPFESELRRRLHWQIWYLDQRASSDYRGPDDDLTQPSTPSSDLILPTNCDDTSLTPTMTTRPIPQPHWTATSFSLIRYEIALTRQHISTTPNWETKVSLAAACEHHIQTHYLAHCDGTRPIHWLARHVAYVLVTEMWMGVYGERVHGAGGVVLTAQDAAMRERLFQAAVDIVDIEKRVAGDAQADRWAWLLDGYYQYVPLAFLLREIVGRWGQPGVEYAWDVAQRAFRRWPEDVRMSAHGVVLGRLMEDVVSMRELVVDWLDVGGKGGYIGDSLG